MARQALLFLIFFSPAILVAQQWKNYTIAASVNCAKVQGDTIWVGSNGGVSKLLYDGTLLATYTKAEGLASDYVTSMAIDKLGNKWFGTGAGNLSAAGVSKFNGASWINFNPYNSGICDSIINAIAVDANNNLWFGTQTGGACKFDGANWTVYNTGNSGLKSNTVSNIVIQTNGDIWFDLCRFDGTNWVNYNVMDSPNPIGLLTCTAIDAEDNLWVGASFAGPPPGTPGGIYEFTGTNWINYSTADANNLYPSIGSMSIDRSGNKWFSLGSGCVLKFDGNNWIEYCDSAILNSSSAMCMVTDSNDNLWLGTISDGFSPNQWIVKFDGVSWNSYNPSNSGLRYQGVSHAFIDKSNNKWFDAVEFDGQNWTNYDSIGSIMVEDSNNIIWAAGGTDVWRFDGHSWTTFINHIAGGEVNCLALDHHNVLWATFGGLGVTKFNGSGWGNFLTAESSGLASDYVAWIAVDNQDNKWIATHANGASKLDDADNWTTYNPSNSGLPDTSVNVVVVDAQGNIWFGTNSQGVAKFDGTHWTVFNSSNSGLPGDWVIAMATDKWGYIWAATISTVTVAYGEFMPMGLSRYDGHNWVTYSTYNSGLADNGINSIAIDTLGNVWLATSTGVCEMIKNDTSFTAFLGFDQNICADDTVILRPTVQNGAPPFTYIWQSYGDSLSCYTCPMPFAVITVPSTFVVTVVDSNNYTTNSSLYVGLCEAAGNHDVNPASGLKVYPNPAGDVIEVNVENPGAGNLIITDMTGRIMLNEAVEQSGTQVLDIGKLADGVYVLTYQNDAARSSQLIVKQ